MTSLNAQACTAKMAQSKYDGAMIPVGYIHRQGNHWELSERPLLDDEIKRGWTQEPVYRAGLAQPEPEVVGPTDEEIMGLMPQQMHDDLAAAVRALAEQEGIDSTPAKGVMRIMLNRHVVDFARAVLARWGRPAPAPAGEVEHAASVRRMCDIILGSTFGNEELDSLALLVGHHPDVLNASPAPSGERQAAPVPVAVSERLPEPGIKVLAHYLNDLGKGRTICAIWVPAKTRSDSYGDDDFTEYDEASDTVYWPEGWYEAIENWEDLGYVKVDEGEVIYWQPLPKWPAHALPLPSGEVEA